MKFKMDIIHEYKTEKVQTQCGTAKLSFYKSNINTDAVNNILYVSGMKYCRIGTADDNEIISSFLSEGYNVCVASWENQNATEHEAHALLQQLLNNGGKWYLVPEGYYLLRERAFWSFSENGAFGTEQDIVNIWNNDFKGVKGEEIIYWADSCGTRKKYFGGRSVANAGRQAG